MSAWRDMSTAPRDGKRILLSRVPAKSMTRTVVIGRHNGWDGSRVWTAETSTYHRDSDFDGWMPLPAPASEVAR